jgi:hypothetical protein
VSSVPDESGSSCILHLREIEGKNADLGSLKLDKNKQMVISSVNVLGEEIIPGSVLLKPFETKFIKLEW